MRCTLICDNSLFLEFLTSHVAKISISWHQSQVSRNLVQNTPIGPYIWAQYWFQVWNWFLKQWVIWLCNTRWDLACYWCHIHTTSILFVHTLHEWDPSVNSLGPFVLLSTDRIVQFWNFFGHVPYCSLCHWDLCHPC